MGQDERVEEATESHEERGKRVLRPALVDGDGRKLEESGGRGRGGDGAARNIGVGCGCCIKRRRMGMDVRVVRPLSRVPPQGSREGVVSLAPTNRHHTVRHDPPKSAQLGGVGRNVIRSDRIAL